jgi:hypothetical protein
MGEIAYIGKVTFYDALPVAFAEYRKTICQRKKHSIRNSSSLAVVFVSTEY